MRKKLIKTSLGLEWETLTFKPTTFNRQTFRNGKPKILKAHFHRREIVLRFMMLTKTENIGCATEKQKKNKKILDNLIKK